MRIHKSAEHNTVQRQLRLRLTLVYANYVKRTFVQHSEILLYVLTLHPASVLIKMYIQQPMHRFYRPFRSCMMEQLFRS